MMVDWQSVEFRGRYIIVSLSGQCISSVTKLRYLGIFLTCSRILTCSTDLPKRSFYRSANAIFGKSGKNCVRRNGFGANQDQMHTSVDVRNGGMPTQKARY